MAGQVVPTSSVPHAAVIIPESIIMSLSDQELHVSWCMNGAFAATRPSLENLRALREQYLLVLAGRLLALSSTSIGGRRIVRRCSTARCR